MTASVPGGPSVGRSRVGILGATGYTGAELLRLLSAHPRAQVTAASSHQHAGKRLGDVWPSLATFADLALEDESSAAEWVSRGIDTVFCALPHGEAAARIGPLLEAGLQVVDLSADFRLRDPALYPTHYAFSHPSPELLAQAVYGLADWPGGQLFGARLIANPGCYATAILLSVLPVLASGLAAQAPLIINAVSGVSGAGRAPKQGLHFVECEENVAPYKVGQEHQHLAEIRQAVALLAKTEATLIFNPHLVPMARGILATISIPLRPDVTLGQVLAVYQDRYRSAPYVRILEHGSLPQTRDVRGSNRCDLAIQTVVRNSYVQVFAAIDNLVKGAAGQAIQNWNLSRGWPVTEGLPSCGWAVA